MNGTYLWPISTMLMNGGWTLRVSTRFTALPAHKSKRALGILMGKDIGLLVWVSKSPVTGGHNKMIFQPVG